MKKEYWILSVSTVIFVVLTFITLWVEPTISRDGTLYLELAGVWQKNGSFQSVINHWNDFWIPPFYLWLIKGLIDIGLQPEVAGRGISMICGAMTPLIAYLIAEEVQDDKKVSLTAAVLMAVNPTVINYSIEIQRDMIYFALCGWTIYFCLRGLSRNEIRSWIPAGICSACSLLSRYETLELIPILLLAVLLFGFMKSISWKRLLCQSALMIVFFAVTVFILIYSMGVEKHISGYYQSYIHGKYIGVEKLYTDQRWSME